MTKIFPPLESFFLLLVTSLIVKPSSKIDLCGSQAQLSYSLVCTPIPALLHWVFIQHIFDLDFVCVSFSFYSQDGTSMSHTNHWGICGAIVFGRENLWCASQASRGRYITTIVLSAGWNSTRRRVPSFVTLRNTNSLVGTTFQRGRPKVHGDSHLQTVGTVPRQISRLRAWLYRTCGHFVNHPLGDSQPPALELKAGKHQQQTQIVAGKGLLVHKNGKCASWVPGINRYFDRFFDNYHFTRVLISHILFGLRLEWCGRKQPLMNPQTWSLWKIIDSWGTQGSEPLIINTPCYWADGLGGAECSGRKCQLQTLWALPGPWVDKYHQGFFFMSSLPWLSL